MYSEDLIRSMSLRIRLLLTISFFTGLALYGSPGDGYGHRYEDMNACLAEVYKLDTGVKNTFLERRRFVHAFWQSKIISIMDSS